MIIQASRTTSPSASNTAERVFLVTGATDGIGKHTATQLATLSNARVLLHGRNEDRGTRTMEDIYNETGNSNLEFFKGDLSLMRDVNQLADDITKAHSKIDVLINNAGVYEPMRKETDEGYEQTWAVNVMAPFLLTWRLLDIIRKGENPRILNVSSVSQTEGGGKLDWDNLQHEKFYDARSAYGLSKLCAVCFTYDLAERLKQDGITVNALDPGTVNTKMLKEGWGNFGIDVASANNEFVLATDPSMAMVSGKYFVRCRETQSCAATYNQEDRLRLWQILEGQTGAVY